MGSTHVETAQGFQLTATIHHSDHWWETRSIVLDLTLSEDSECWALPTLTADMHCSSLCSSYIGLFIYYY